MPRAFKLHKHAFFMISALSIAGCASQIELMATGARSQTLPTAHAIVSPGAAGSNYTIDNPTALPSEIQSASTLRAVVGGRSVPVTRTAAGALQFTLPAGTNALPDVDGTLRVVFVMGDRDSQIVVLATGSPLDFATPAVRIEPNNGFIARGLKLKLSANTQASAESYQFTWSYSASAQGPWQTIPGAGKQVEWEPAAAGNYFLKVDAIDKKTQVFYSATTPNAVVFVTDSDDVVTTQPADGSVQRGNAIKLSFTPPAGLTGSRFSYAWSVSPSAQGPWSVVAGNASSINWLPTTAGSYFARATVTNLDTGAVNTFVSGTAAVHVTEGQAIVIPSQNSLERGDGVTLSLNVPDPGKGPFTWYYSLAGSPVSTWLPINSGTNAAKINHVVNEAGSYNFRVDFPDSAGIIKTFTTSEPVLNVHEGIEKLITSDPPNATIGSGGTVGLILNAKGVDETNYKYTWYCSANPGYGWTALPVTNASLSNNKTYTWKTQQIVTIGPTQVNQVQAAGSYFIRVDAAQKVGPAVYTFTSASPVVTIEP